MGVWDLRWAVLRVYRLRVFVCVSERKVHVFQLVYQRSPVKLVWAGGGGLVAANAQSRTFSLIARNANTKT